jgi:hypothetical protein
MKKASTVFAIVMCMLSVVFRCNTVAVSASEIYNTDCYGDSSSVTSKKGISYHDVEQIAEAGLDVHYGFIDIVYSDLEPQTYSSAGHTCGYEYNGNTLYFSDSKVNEYDIVISNMNKKGIIVTVGLINDKLESGSSCEELISRRQREGYLALPDSSTGDENTIKKSNVKCYGFDIEDSTVKQYVEIITRFLADRYDGNGIQNDTAAFVSNWVVGDEVNDRLGYYYMGTSTSDFDVSYVQDYADVFCIVYDDVKEYNTSANVYVCLEHVWGENVDLVRTIYNYSGKKFLNTFDAQMQAHYGKDIDWGLAYHPYSFPVDKSVVWDDGEKEEVITGEDSAIITMFNIEVLTDYMRTHLLYDGQPRSIILSEQGYESNSAKNDKDPYVEYDGELLQAASIAYAYYKAECNPDIDAFILYRFCDNEKEVLEGKGDSYGITVVHSSDYDESKNKYVTTISHYKYAYNIYKYIDTECSATLTSFAKDLIGIKDWAEVIPNFTGSRFDMMDYSAVYDADYYYNNNDDVKAVYGDNLNDRLNHFINYGMAEGRQAKADFNVFKYMYGTYNDDLRNVFGSDLKQYYLHYINYGKAEKRLTSEYDAVFDASYYISNNSDVEGMVENKKYNKEGWALWHFYEYGINEYRKGSSDFGVLNYMAANSDVYSTYKDDCKAAVTHYLQYGIVEKRPTEVKLDIYTIPVVRADVVEVYGNNPMNWIQWYLDYGQYQY